MLCAWKKRNFFLRCTQLSLSCRYFVNPCFSLLGNLMVPHVAHTLSVHFAWAYVRPSSREHISIVAELRPSWTTLFWQAWRDSSALSCCHCWSLASLASSSSVSKPLHRIRARTYSKPRRTRPMPM